MTASQSPKYSREKQRSGRVPLFTKILQGIGQLPSSHKDWAFGTFLLLYYSQILGVSASAASAVLAFALFVDAFTDPIMGSISDNFRSKYGRRHLFMYAAALPLGVSFFMLFSPPSGLTETGLVAWLLVWTLAVRLSFTVYVVPWSALGAEFTEDYEERTAIYAFRAMMGWLGGASFVFLVYTYVFPSSADTVGQLDPNNYPTFAIVLGVVIVCWVLITTHGTLRDVPYLLQPTEKSKPFSFQRTFNEIRMALQNPNFRRVFIMVLTFFGVAGTNAVFDIYMNTYFWGLASEDLRWMTLSFLGALVALAFVGPLQKIYDKQRVATVTCALLVVTIMSKVMLRFLGVLPENGDPLLLYLLVSIFTFQVFLLTLFGVLAASFLPDMVDEQELKFGHRQEGVFASAFSLAAKATTGLGLLLGGMLLDFFVAFPRGADPSAIDPAIITRLGITDGILVPAFFAIPIYALSRYSLTREKLVDIQKGLQLMRNGGGLETVAAKDENPKPG